MIPVIVFSDFKYTPGAIHQTMLKVENTWIPKNGDLVLTTDGGIGGLFGYGPGKTWTKIVLIEGFVPQTSALSLVQVRKEHEIHLALLK